MTVVVQPRPLNVRKMVIVTTVLVAFFVYTYLLREPAAPPYAEIRGQTMGTTYSVKIAGAHLGEKATGDLKREIDDYLAEINDRMSTYLPDSEISAFNLSRSTEPMIVSEDFATVAAFSLELSRASMGAFDPTVGSLINLWGFGATRRDLPEPDTEALAAALAVCGFERLEVALPETIRKAEPELEICLDAVAKGYAVDGVAELLTRRGWPDFFVEIGGEVRVRGNGPEGRPWRIGVDYPDPASLVGARFLAILDLTDCAVATSGDYRNFRRGKQGQRASHFIDPRTGRPVEDPLASATIIASTCMVADGLATAAAILRADEALHLLEAYPTAEALLVVREADGTLREVATPGFSAYRTASE